MFAAPFVESLRSQLHLRASSNSASDSNHVAINTTSSGFSSAMSSALSTSASSTLASSSDFRNSASDAGFGSSSSLGPIISPNVLRATGWNPMQSSAQPTLAHVPEASSSSLPSRFSGQVAHRTTAAPGWESSTISAAHRSGSTSSTSSAQTHHSLTSSSAAVHASTSPPRTPQRDSSTSSLTQSSSSSIGRITDFPRGAMSCTPTMSRTEPPLCIGS